MKGIAAFSSCLLLALAATGNDAAMNDGAEGPEPIGWRSGTESIVQMKSEHLSIRFGVDRTSVVARFTFLSHKTGGPATQKLGFPDASRSELDGDIIGPIEDLVTRVDGRVVESKLVEGWFQEIVKPDGSIYYEKKEKPAHPEEAGLTRKHAWHVIEVEFPVGEEVVVEREYACPTGRDTSMNAFFIYETRTGGAWRGEIERLTAEVTFAEDIRSDLIGLSPKEGWTWSDDPRKATLTWEHFEPRTDEDRNWFEISTLDVERVEEIHRENPEDFPPLEDWIRGWKRQQEERE